MLTHIEPVFLYPRSKLYPFDSVCEQIVLELEKRNWDVSGIEVEMATYGSGEAKYTLVRTVKGSNFQLHYSRVQGLLSDGHFNDTAAVHTLSIPKMELTVYGDRCGPNLIVYVGRKWAKDQEWFLKSSKLMAKLHKEPRRYLRYKNKGEYGLGGALLSADNDLGREYEPNRREPAAYAINTIYQEFTTWLDQNVLAYIRSFPVQSLRRPIPEPLIPFPKTIGPFYTFIRGADAERIEEGKTDPKQLPPAKRYAIDGGGKRLLTIDVPNDGSFLDLAYDGFTWCQPGDIQPDTPLSSIPEYIGKESRGFRNWIAVVQPKYANDIYVVDTELQELYRDELIKNNPSMTELSRAQWTMYNWLLARTLISISRYQGDYKKPVILVKRSLNFDEIVRIFEIPKR